MHEGYPVLKIYTKIMLYATIIIGGMTIINYKMYGEGVGLNLSLDRTDIFLILCVQCLFILLAFPVFKKTKELHFAFGNKKRIHFKINDKIHWFVLGLLIAEIIFTVKTGNGIVGQSSSSSGTLIAYVFNVLKISVFMPIYYVTARKKRTRIYWINIVMWVIYELVCGWTSIILEAVFIEYYLRVKENPNSNLSILSYKLAGGVAFVATMIGGFIYKYGWVLKNTIRYGYSFNKLSYFEGVSKLVSRFTSFPLSVVSVQNHTRIVQLYKAQGIGMVDVLAVFRPLLPGSIMPVKDFRTLNNIVVQSMYLDLSNSTSSDYGLAFMWHNLISASFSDFVIYLIATFVFLVISKKIIYAFDSGNGNVDILYFFLIFQFLNGFSIENLFGYGYIGLVYLIPIMVFLGLIKITRY